VDVKAVLIIAYIQLNLAMIKMGVLRGNNKWQINNRK
jgi:hypothetical protein